MRRLTVLLLLAALSGQHRDPRAILTDIDALVAELRLALDPIVPPAGDLQAALEQAKPGQTVALTPGATYVGNFVLPAGVTLQTAGVDLQRRVTPPDRGALASIVSPNVSPAVLITGSQVTLRALHIQGPSNDLVSCGRNDARQTRREQQPRQIVLDQLLIEGDPQQGAKRGIALHCAEAAVTRSTIRGIWRLGQDSQAIAGVNGDGPFLIEDNFLEAASENILFGGADPQIPGLIPSNITIRRNTLTKDLAWRNQRVNVKNLLELKIGRHVRIEGNWFQYNWKAAQTGWAIVLTPSQYGSNPGAVIEDVLIAGNVIRDVGGGLNVLGTSQHLDRPTGLLQRLTVQDNWFVIDAAAWGGAGVFLQLGLGPRALTIAHNTIEQTGSRFLSGTGAPVLGFAFTDNLVKVSGSYGIFTTGSDGQNYAHGLRWREYFPDGTIVRNALVDFSRPSSVPDNLFVSASQATVEDGYGVGVLKGYGRRSVNSVAALHERQGAGRISAAPHALLSMRERFAGAAPVAHAAGPAAPVFPTEMAQSFSPLPVCHWCVGEMKWQMAGFLPACSRCSPHSPLNSTMSCAAGAIFLRVLSVFACDAKARILSPRVVCIHAASAGTSIA